MKFQTEHKRKNKKNPGDAEAVEGMGSISSHKGEHLMPTDKGVMIYRRRIRKLTKDLEDGRDPPQPQKIKGQVVRTNGQDTILKAPKKIIMIKSMLNQSVHL